MAVNTLKHPRPKGDRFYRWVWMNYGRRQHPRNTSDVGGIYKICVYWFLAFIGILFFEYWPFRIMGTLVMVAFVGVALWEGLKMAHKTPTAGVMNILLGSIGLLTHWHFHLTFFNHHFEKYLFWGCLGCGVLSLIRRGWNALIWKLLDKSGRQGVLASVRRAL